MTLYTLYIFNKFGDCIFYTAWARSTAQDPNESRLVGGLIYTLQQLVSSVSPSGVGNMLSIRTAGYKLHYRETTSGYRIALTTDADFATYAAQELLDAFFLNVFVEWTVKDPAYRHAPGVKITSSAFVAALRQFVVDRKLAGGLS
jgi:hypothetical protein